MRRIAFVLRLSLALCLPLFLLLVPMAATAQEPPHPDEQTDHRGFQEEDPEAEAAAVAEVEGEEGEEEEDKGWDVNEPFGPSKEVTLDSTEGTWMNLDVSPDGTEIVFDLLGDLYTVPIGGGEATALTSGLAWDMQPRYSPDGRHIAFTSDRAGGDNVWVLERGARDDDGEPAEPTQVTKESFRLVNSPAWSPDGDWIVVRKHFVSQRSLGAGELWMYHRTGSTGLQLTDRPNDQKDVGEPVFSPDGRYVYYSQDTTPGETFQYNKDPNPGIYSILRLDLDEGDSDYWITGAGGAIRPTPSPDGDHVAFLRRVRGENTLWLRHVASGTERQVVSGLDRDMQETWAVHGVYPTMAWTPDSGSLVFWSEGGIRRLDVGSGRVAEIPFHVRATHTLLDPLRYPVDVAPETFRTKMLRWVRVSPTGDRVAFESLGKIWLRDLSPNGEVGPARRLTVQDDHFEAYPSWSRDGRSLVYVSWDDRELGAVRMTAARPGQRESRVLTTEPGYYVEPSLAPDGRTVVFRKTGGGYVTHPAWSEDSGLYRVTVSGSGSGPGNEMDRVIDSGRQPHFGADPDRMYFLDFEGRGDDGPKRVLRSVELDGSDLRTHVTSSIATELVVSPAGDYLAWAEGYHAYVTPLVATGRPVDVGAGAEALPVARVSSDAGSWIHWSGDGEKLYWSMGPELFSRALPEAFAFLPGAPEELPDPPAMGSGVDLSMEIDSAAPESRMALVGGRVIPVRADGEPGEVIEDGVVLVDGNRITAVGARGDVEVPDGVRVVDVTGKTVMPGIVDVHWHGSQGESFIPETNWVNYASLAFGVTTLHDPSNDTSTIFAAAEMARAGEILAPRIFSTGTILYGAFGDFKATVNSLEDAERHLRRMKAVGAISVKSYNQPRREQRQQILQAARELEMMVVPEGGSLLQHNLTMVVDGHTGIEHSIPVAPVYEDVLQLWGSTPVGYTPTLGVGYGGIWGENYWYAETKVWEDERLLTFAPREVIDARSRRRITVPEEEWGHFENARTAKQILDRGVPVQIGAHGQREGLAAHWEIWMLEQGGFTPWEALRAATLDGARYLGLDGDVGSLEAGKLADVLVLSGNPLEDIRQTRSVEQVMLNGRLYDAATMDQIAPERVERPEFWWEVDPGEVAGLGGE